MDMMCLDVCGVYVSVCRCTGILGAGCDEHMDGCVCTGAVESGCMSVQVHRCTTSCWML